MNKQNLIIYRWLWLGIVLVLMLVAVGGITRLTDSGLSMTNWNLLLDMVPPMNESEWQAEFMAYQNFPEYIHSTAGMTLHEFKFIYFWEYLHRLIARVIGLVFILPAAFFFFKGWLSSAMKRDLGFLLLLGALQAAMGWIMVKSGLVDVPYVSHYRLAAHLFLALLIVGFCYYIVQKMKYQQFSITISQTMPQSYTWISGSMFILFLLQVIWGAFTAGLDAGLIYNTFPKMNNGWIPEQVFALQALFESQGFVQLAHRVLGTLLLAAAAGFGLWTEYTFTDLRLLKRTRLLVGLILSQYALGIGTLLMSVPVYMGVIHQIMAFLILLSFIHLYVVTQYTFNNAKTDNTLLNL